MNSQPSWGEMRARQNALHVCSFLPYSQASNRPSRTQSLPPIYQLTRRRPRSRSSRFECNIASGLPVSAALHRYHGALNFLAGSMASALSVFFTAPLEALRTRMQSSGGSKAGQSLASVAVTVIRNDGLLGLYRGVGASLLTYLPSRSIYFTTYHRCKKTLERISNINSAFVHFLSAVVAGTTNSFVLSPLSVVRTRMQLGTSRYKGYVDAFTRMMREEGPGSFYRGLSASIWGTSEAAIQFMLYEKLKSWQALRQGRRPEELSALQYSAIAATSKLIAAVAAYPCRRVRVLMRELPPPGSCLPKYRTVVQSFRLIAREEGWLALYRGLGCHLARAVPSAAVMFLAYEMISKGFEKRQVRKLVQGTRDPRY